MLFHRIRQYELIGADGRWYRPWVYGDPQADGSWDGWLVFFLIPGGSAIAPPTPETHQSTLEALTVWAAGLTSIYLEGALARALALAEESSVIDKLEAAEHAAAAEAERLETAAAVDRNSAELHHAAATVARADAERLRRERLATDEALAATEEAVAILEAEVNDQIARDARRVAAAAEKSRRRPASRKRISQSPTKRPKSTKK